MKITPHIADLNSHGQRRQRRAHKQTVLEAAARDHNWLLGRLREAETRFNRALRDALEYADAGYLETCKQHSLLPNRSKVFTYQRAASSMIRDVVGRVRDRFQWVRVAELSRPGAYKQSSTSKEPHP
jgi:hypothetical protein